MSEWLCPWYSENEIVKASIQAMERIYERLLNGNVYKCAIAQTHESVQGDTDYFTCPLPHLLFFVFF